MESSEKYWTPSYNILKTDCKIVLHTPSMTKRFEASKPTKNDAKWIPDILYHDLVSDRFIPPSDIRHLPDLIATLQN